MRLSAVKTSRLSCVNLLSRWHHQGLPEQSRARLDTATRDFSLSPPAERGERAGERGIDGFADLGGSGFPTGRPPLPSPLLQRRRGRSGRGLVAVSRCARRKPTAKDLADAKEHKDDLSQAVKGLVGEAGAFGAGLADSNGVGVTPARRAC